MRFTVEQSGAVIDVTVVRSSGSPRLDAAAEDMLRGARVPPFDSAMGQQRITATVQIRYSTDTLILGVNRLGPTDCINEEHF